MIAAMNYTFENHEQSAARIQARQAQACLILTGEVRVGDTNFRLESRTKQATPVQATPIPDSEPPYTP